MEDVVWVDFKMMENFAADVLKRLGVPENDARICADAIVFADRFGIDSHGINRMKQMYYDRIKEGVQKPVTDFEIVREGPTTAVIDGHDGIGQVISKKSMELAIRKAKKYGMGMAAVRNSSHYGAAGYYVLMAANQGMIGITGTNTRPSVAPTFGVENMLGTNPLTFAMPTDEDFPLLHDCATSASVRGRIEAYAKQGKPIPEGWVIDKHGRVRTDSEQILADLIKGDAALIPLGGVGEGSVGHKGYGYAVVVEILSAALQGGSFLKMLLGFQDGKKVPYHLGHFFIAINISAFTELDEFKKTAGDILRQIRASKKMPGHDRIYTPGEMEHLKWMERKDKGIPVKAELQAEIKHMMKELDLKYNFPF
jgi:LDH2 family malate/lactate/ureidoglycolate dehydrogenase